MFDINNGPLEDRIVALLYKGQIKTTALIDRIQKLRPKTTKQAVYKALRALKSVQIVVVHNKYVSLNLRWIMNMSKFFAGVEHFYFSSNLSTGHFASLKDREKISYIFNNPITADVFWDHAIYILLEITNQKDDWFAYNRHCWFFIAREKDERLLRDHIVSIGRRYLVTVGSQTQLDRSVVKEFDVEKSQYNMLEVPLYSDDSYYLNIIGDYLIEVWFDAETTKNIESAYKQMQNSDNAKDKLNKILTCKGKTKITISRNNRKATRLKNILKPAFYFPKTA